MPVLLSICDGGDTPLTWGEDVTSPSLAYNFTARKLMQYTVSCQRPKNRVYATLRITPS